MQHPANHACWQVGSEGGAEEPALRHLWRGRMGTNKQEQLDLYMGRTVSDEDSSDADDVQNSGREALQAAQSASVDAKGASANGAYAMSCACRSADAIHTSTAHMPDAFGRDNRTNATIDMSAGGADADSRSSDADTSSSSEPDSGSESSDDDLDGTNADSTSSDADTSWSDSGSESSDDDPDGVPPVRV